MRPTGLGHGVYKDAIDYAVFSGAWNSTSAGAFRMPSGSSGRCTASY
jgi:hypothetical protein